MIWLNPAALLALAAIVAPILIHILIQRRAERFAFPSLRFLQPTRLAAIRRHLLEDLPLLVVRIAILAVAAAALAGPLLVTAARKQAWDRRVVRAVVRGERVGGAGERVGAELARPASTRAEQASPLRQAAFEGASLGDGIRRAVLWLDKAPPARREIVIASPLPIGSIAPSDLAAIPADIGIRFERTGALPQTRTVSGGRLLTVGGVRTREVTIDRDRTAVHEAAAADPVTWPIDLISPPEMKPMIDAAVSAVLSQRVWAAPGDRRARLFVSDPAQGFSAATMTSPWMADAVARIARDTDLRAAASRVVAGFPEARFANSPWQTVATAADGRPLVVAAGSPDRLVVVSAAPAADVATPVLVRAMANALGGAPDLQGAEVMPIPDATIAEWSRPAAPLTVPRIDSIEQDDRRWLWLVVLILLALETWMRRTRVADATAGQREEQARVA